MGLSPAGKEIQSLSNWQIGLIYETVMNYPVEGLRKSYFDSKKSPAIFEDDDLYDMGYSPEEIARIKGDNN